MMITLALILDNPVDKGNSDSFFEMKQIFEKSIVAPCHKETVFDVTGPVGRHCMQLSNWKEQGFHLPVKLYWNFI